MSKSNNNLYITGITLVATLGGLLFGYDTAVISGTVESLEKYFVLPLGLAEDAAHSLKGFVISSAIIGCIVGGAIAGWTSDFFGRKKSLIIAAVLFLISAVGSAYPEIGFAGIGELGHEAINNFIVYRIIGGIGVGIASMNSPLYISEIAPADRRGVLVSFNQLAIIFGMVVVYFVNYYIASSGDDGWLHASGWRWMFASEIVPASMFLMFLFFVPETPRWLVMKGKDDTASTVLGKILTPDRAKSVLGDIKASLNKKETKSLLTFGGLVILVGILLSAFQQFIGVNVVLYYAPQIFKEMGFSTDSAFLTTILVGVVNFAFTIIAILTVDKYGRKPLMIIGALLMAVSMTALGLSFLAEGAAALSLTSMILYMASFALSWGPVTWVLLSEMFPNAIRSWAMAIAVAAQWICNFLVSWTFPMMDENSFLIEKFHHGFAYWIYGAMGIIAAFFVWKLVPETKGKTLEEMEDLWGGEKEKDKTTSTQAQLETV